MKIYITKDKTSFPHYLNVRYIEADADIHYSTQMWKTTSLQLEKVTTFLVLEEPYTISVDSGYVIFNGIMLPQEPGYGRFGRQHKCKIYKYFLSVHNFDDGSIVELK
jgi:hypothetical protein